MKAENKKIVHFEDIFLPSPVFSHSAVVRLQHQIKKELNKMELMSLSSKRKILLFASIMHLFASNIVQGQTWSIEFILNCDSSVYTLSQNKILQGKPVDFFFPSYKFNQISSNDAVESVKIGNGEVVELELDTRHLDFENIHFEIDLYAEEIDTLWFFMKTTNDRLIPLAQRTHRNGYTYLPTVTFAVNIIKNDIQSIQIVGKSKNEDKKFIVGRVNGSKKIEFVAEDILAVDSLVSKYSFEKQSDTFFTLPDFYLKLHGFSIYSRLVLKECWSTYDSIYCIRNFFTSKILNEYSLYDVYGVNKQKLIDRSIDLAETSKDIESYYNSMKEVISSLNSCHMRLSTSQQDDIESPLQAIYFYNINNEIVVSAVFDPTIEHSIHLGDRLLSINNIPLGQLYSDFSKKVFASTSQQREIKITQKLLYLARELFGDSLLLKFKNNTDSYSIWLNKSNFSGKKVIPSDFKIVSDNLIEKYHNIVYMKPVFQESSLIPYLYSHKTDLNHCDGMIIDLRGCSSADYSFCSFFSCLIAENSLILTSDSSLFSIQSDYNYIIKPSTKINIKEPIVVLIDARTACASELMINAFRKIRPDIYVMGATNTAGSAQFAMQVALPRNATLNYFEGIARDAFGKIIDNNIGVIPDRVVSFDVYKDLFPYEDKLKYIALEYFGHTLKNMKKNIQY